MTDVTPIPAKRQSQSRNRGLLRKLRTSETGNVMAITAAAIVPLIALIGGGVDLSRIYLTKARLQQACDAGALAGRKSMIGANWTTSSGEVAHQYFNMNFPNGKYGTETIDVDYSGTPTGVVNGEAAVKVPMTLMSLFDVPDHEVTVTCAAEFHLPNTEVMFVLDTTLSMNDSNPGDNDVERIVIMREALRTFHRTLQNARPDGSRIRYGFVPYSMTVNVGMLLRPEWIVDEAVYDSRRPDRIHRAPDYVVADEEEEVTIKQVILNQPKQETSYGSAENCVKPADNTVQEEPAIISAWRPSDTALPRERDYTYVKSGVEYSAGIVNGKCVITKTIYDKYTKIDTRRRDVKKGGIKTGAPYYHWFYGPRAFSMANLKKTDSNGRLIGGTYTETLNGTFANPIENPDGSRSLPLTATMEATWDASNACIEERAAPNDMNVDLVPNSEATRWQPYLPALVYARQATLPTAGSAAWQFSGDVPETSTFQIDRVGSGEYYSPNNWRYTSARDFVACPLSARQFAEMDEGQFDAYIDLFQPGGTPGANPGGYTYHDIGFLWGLRLMSREGLFADEHRAVEDRDGTYARNLIFMTDGELDVKRGAYTAWGIEALTRRRTPVGEVPTNERIAEVTRDRLARLCTLAKEEKHITVWVIAFGKDVTLSPMLTNCASDGRAFKAENGTELNRVFAEIASRVAALRITG